MNNFQPLHLFVEMHDIFDIDLGPDLQRHFCKRPYVKRALAFYFISLFLIILLFITCFFSDLYLLKNVLFWILLLIFLSTGSYFYFQKISIEVRDAKMKITYGVLTHNKTLDEPISNYKSIVSAQMNPINWLGEEKKRDDFMIAIRHKDSALPKDVVVYFGNNSSVYEQYKEKYATLLQLPLEEI